MTNHLGRLLVSGALASAALIPLAPAGFAEPAQPVRTGDVACTTRSAYFGGVTVTNKCNRTIRIKVQWTYPAYFTGCYAIGPYDKRSYPKPSSTSRYISVHAC
ncbi:hypothetical protein [Actinomadura rubrisoli]|uniref:Uncharacterized protein n=1 Tax=Actinomadura rubrisoli TaxID=2530368 RepID=A0A4R5CF25_9ACTN|nr:hypothetical protein [Actinomadura rubrisoli]TDD98185.1 hypothetical protein E1298_00540 [Actinomadura rubrisoli]